MIRNPYVGPRTFEESESQFFFGRDEETEILAGLVMARRAALFFAQSGAGKSSLLRAGLIPELSRQETMGHGRRAVTYQKMWVLPILTVGGGIPSQMSQPIANIYVVNALLSLFPDAPPDKLARLTLTDSLAPFFSPNDIETDPGLVPTCPNCAYNAALLIFDQFEELFTRHPTHQSEREDFFQQVSQALEAYPILHVLFTIREDYIAELTPYANLLPEQLRPRFRMERLKREAALQAIQQPAARAGRPFAEGVAEALVDNLRRTQPGQTISNLQPPELGAYIEPVHLQIVCHQLWANLPPDRTTILAEDVQEFGDVDQALIGFYEAALKTVIVQNGISERRLRTWIDTHLITPARTRGLVYRGEDETEGLPNAAVDILNNAYIIRANIRGSDTWYELTHDRLVEPIWAANRAWEDKHQDPLTLAAEAWLASGKDPQKLYRGDQLKEARAQAEATPEELTEVEKEFISVSLETARLQAVKRQRLILVGAGVLLALFASLAGSALFSARQAAQQRATAQAASTLAIANERTALAERATALAASTAAIEQKAIALSAKETSETRRREAETAVAVAKGALGALEDSFVAQLSAAEATPTLVPTSGTPTPPTWRPTDTPTPTPNQAATATVQALQAQLDGVRATQTAVAMIASCPAEPEGEFRDIWDRYRGRLGCPIQTTPTDGFFAEQPFENGYMFWAQIPDLFVVTIGDDKGTWYLFRVSEITWSWNFSGTSCEPDVPPGPGQVQPIRGFGGLWCAREDIREAIGFATAEEYGVGNNLLQEFQSGAILRDSHNFVYLLFGDDGTYVRETY
jgi:hypothetical protein